MPCNCPPPFPPYRPPFMPRPEPFSPLPRRCPQPDPGAWIKEQLAKKYEKPEDGIPKSDLAAGVQASLDNADTAVQPEGIAGFVDGAEYDAEYGDPPKPTILLKHGSEVVATVDAADFVIDGMVSNVKIENGSLVITFNTDSGKQPISIPLTDIFDPGNYYTKTDVNGLLAGKQDALTFDATPTAGSQNPVTSEGIKNAIDAATPADYAEVKAQVQTNTGDIADIKAVVPSAATAQNKLVDTQTMNSSIATNTANFLGTYSYVTDLGFPQPSSAADVDNAAIATALGGLTFAQTPTNNDYVFVSINYTPTTDVDEFRRFKYNDTTHAWAYEYTLNNSSFTAAQWAAINSGITSGDVTKLAGIAAGAQVNVIETVKVNGTALTPENKAVNIPVPAVVAPSTSASDSGKAADAKATGDALAGKASTADATLDYRWEINPATSPDGFTYSVFWNGSYQTWLLRTAPDSDQFLNIGFDATSFSEEVDGITITGTRSPGYQLGSQTDKPLASEAEAEALRTGKLDKSSVVAPSTSVLDIGKAADARATGSALAGKLSTSGGTVAGGITLYNPEGPQGSAVIYFPIGGNGKLYFGSGLFSIDDTTQRVTIKGIDAATVSDIPYTLGTPIVIDTASSEVVEGETVYYGAATLANRTANIVRVTAATALDELRITFPAATSGKVRDFGLRVEIGTGSAALAAPALVPIAPTGETIKIENADGTIPELADGTATAKGVTLLYFSETAPGVFVVKGEQVEEVA